MRIPAAIMIFIFSLLGACATATPYQSVAENTRYGYSDIQIESNRWKVSFSGNSVTDQNVVETYLLYRAAEITAANGFDYFEIIDQETDENRRLVHIPYFPYYHGLGFSHRYYGPHGRIYPGAHRVGFRAYGSFGPRPYRHAFGPDPWGFYNSFYTTHESVRYEASAEIIARRGSKPDGPSFFNASDVKNYLGQTIERPQ